MKKHVFIITLGLLLGVFLGYYVRGSELVDSVELISFTYTFVFGLCGVAVAYAIYVLTLKLDQIFPWQTQPGGRLLAGIFIHFITSLILVLGLFYSYQKAFLEPLNFVEAYSDIIIKLAIILFISVFIFVVIYFALYSYYSYADLQIKTVKHERKQIDLQLKALKEQLSPHFLFNSLNTISSLIFTDTHKANLYIRGLAKMYQYTLKSYHNKLIALSEELDFVTSYLYLLEIRFEKMLICDIDIPDSIKVSKIPPLTLQMLIENAVKHNQLDLKTPLKIEITSDENFISIRNNITQAPKQVSSLNIGLNNINARYLLLRNKGIVIIKDVDFTVKIPVIR